MSAAPKSALDASAYLHHLHLKSPQPDKLAAFYADTMEMVPERVDGGWLLRGPGRRLLVSEGAAGKLAQAGFAVRDEAGLAGLRAQAEAAGLQPETASEPLMRPGAFRVTDPDGNVAVFGLSAGEDPPGKRRRAPLQHLTLATRNVQAIEDFYAGKLGFGVSDRVVNDAGEITTCFMRGNHEHHNLACFLHRDRQGIDHHSYEAGEWDTIRDWCDYFAERDIQLMWGPGRHGPGNNLFIFIVDPDGNWIEVSAEIEVIHDRPVKHWPHGERTLNLWGRAILRS
jgi:catechol 2,3-dioxygenase-like lactoylglutathione lyase family enzyme